MAEAIAVEAPTPRIRKVELDRPWAWLAAGWHDLTGAPSVGLAYGVLFALVGWAITFGLWWLGAIYLILPLTAGFLIMGWAGAAWRRGQGASTGIRWRAGNVDRTQGSGAVRPQSQSSLSSCGRRSITL